MKKHSVNIHGHQTSITLEDEFWEALKSCAHHRNISLNKIIAQIDDARITQPAHKKSDPQMPAFSGHNLSSAIRLYILHDLQNRLLHQKN